MKNGNVGIADVTLGFETLGKVYYNEFAIRKAVNNVFRQIILAVSCFSISHAFASVLYVDVNSTNPTPPYVDLATAAVSIQSAVDVASNTDLILVNDGIYQDGSRVIQESISSGFPPKTISSTNRLVLGKELTVQSLNGPGSAFISGGGDCRCVYLMNGAVLSGFTLINGVAGYLTTTQNLRGGMVTITNILNGGAVAGTNGLGSGSALVSNCVLTASQAWGNGGGAYRVNLVDCALSGNKATSGGGAYDSTLVNCIVAGNSAQTNQSAPNPGVPTWDVPTGVGGGIYLCSALNCLIASNNAFEGGGVFDATGLKNCTIVNNHASHFGGVYLNGYSQSPYSYASNCLIYFNTAGTNANFGVTNLFADHCCTFPLPPGGDGNITNNPALVDPDGGNFHLQADSPCINAGKNSFVSTTTALDGDPRIAGGTVDIGAYEYQTPSSVLSYAWAQQYGLPTDGTGDYADSDSDGLNNWQEWIAGTIPTNSASVLILQLPTAAIGTGIKLMWQSVNTRTYYLQCSTNLPFFSSIRSNLVGQAGTTSFTDTTATNGGPYFYRVGVQ